MRGRGPGEGPNSSRSGRQHLDALCLRKFNQGMRVGWRQQTAPAELLRLSARQLLERPIDGDPVSLEADDRAVGVARIRPHAVDPFEIDHDRADRLRFVAVEDDLIAAKKLGYLISPVFANYGFRLPWPMPGSIRNAASHSSGQSNCVRVLDHHSLSTAHTPPIPVSKHPRRGKSVARLPVA